jgi:hypothetical protein
MKGRNSDAAKEDQMSATFWTISIMAGVVFVLGSAINHIGTLF